MATYYEKDNVKITDEGVSFNSGRSFIAFHEIALVTLKYPNPFLHMLAAIVLVALAALTAGLTLILLVILVWRLYSYSHPTIILHGKKDRGELCRHMVSNGEQIKSIINAHLA